MTGDLPLEGRNLIGEVIELAGSDKAFTDIHIEPDSPLMIHTPRGWQKASADIVAADDLRPMLDAIDVNWEESTRRGAIDRPFVLSQCRLRCNVYRVSGGQKLAVSIRRLPLQPYPLEKTGLPVYVKTMLESNRGLILVTGPTGSGKTTTIASMLDYINYTRNAHIISIENPIEYQLVRKHSIISQKEVPTDTVSFATGLREALRQKPDVLMVGEVRDFETADTVLHASESGHMVMATMHTNSALTAITKLLSFFASEQREQRAATLANALIGVVCQSLVPTEDGEGFVLASELIFNNNQQVAPYIADTTKLNVLADFMRRREDNMSRCLNEDLAQLVAKKIINAKDAMRVTYNRIELRDMLGGKR